MAANLINKDIEKVLISERKLKKTAKRLGKMISKDYRGKPLMLIGVLKGSVICISDIMREITIPCRLDFMVASSYRDSTSSSGNVEILYDLPVDISNYDVLIVEDIVDTGYTLSLLRDVLLARNPRSLKICAMLDKPSKRVTPLQPDYVGIEVPDKFVVGYGLDFAENYRNLPYIGVLKEEMYSPNKSQKDVKDIKDISELSKGITD